MSFKSAGCLDCSLTRYLEEASELDTDMETAMFAAVVLSYLGYFQFGQVLDDRSLQQLTEILAERGQDSLSADLQQRCMQCPSKIDCPVGKIVLKG